MRHHPDPDDIKIRSATSFTFIGPVTEQKHAIGRSSGSDVKHISRLRERLMPAWGTTAASARWSSSSGNRVAHQHVGLCGASWLKGLGFRRRLGDIQARRTRDASHREALRHDRRCTEGRVGKRGHCAGQLRWIRLDPRFLRKSAVVDLVWSSMITATVIPSSALRSSTPVATPSPEMAEALG